MKYMMLIAGSEEAWAGLSHDEEHRLMGEIGQWWNDQMAAGRITEGYQLQPSATATTVRTAGAGGPSVTDGPYVDAKEVIGGYGILDVANLDEAIAVASAWPGPDVLEIRPVVERES
ncbi:MAG TPA: YciI family protein [Candidatus Limnocylindria bacterium]|nr:YciI family protein [Candidatus Limnocylindria bacterium]